MAHGPQGSVHASSQAFQLEVGHCSGSRSLSSRIRQVSSLNGSLHLSYPDVGGIICFSAWIDPAPLTSWSLQAGLSGRGWTGIMNAKVALVPRSMQ